jgi:hypothetical protein
LTFNDLQRSLPNGLHDAELLAVRIDYSAQTAVLELNIDVSDASAQGQGTVQYRPARLMFSQLQFIAVDPPGSGYEGIAPSMIDAGQGQPVTAPCSLPTLDGGAFLCWIFIARMNAFLRIAAADVGITWEGPDTDETQSP